MTKSSAGRMMREQIKGLLALGAVLAAPALALAQSTNFMPNPSFENPASLPSGVHGMGLGITSWGSVTDVYYAKSFYSGAPDGTNVVQFGYYYLDDPEIGAVSAIFPSSAPGSKYQYVLALSAAPVPTSPSGTKRLDYEFTPNFFWFGYMASFFFPHTQKPAYLAQNPTWYSRANVFNYDYSGPKIPEIDFVSSELLIDDAYLFETRTAVGVGPAAGYVARPTSVVTGNLGQLAAADFSSLSLKTTINDDHSKFLFATYVSGPAPAALTVNATMKRNVTVANPGSASATILVFDWVKQQWVQNPPLPPGSIAMFMPRSSAMSSTAWVTYSKNVVALGGGSAANFIKAVPDLSGVMRYVVLTQVSFSTPFDLSAVFTGPGGGTPPPPNPPFEILIDRAWAQ